MADAMLQAGDDLTEALKIGIAWLGSDQPDGALITHHGITRVWDGRVLLSIVPRTKTAGVLSAVVFDVANRRYGDELEILNPFTPDEVSSLRAAVADVAEVADTWNGVGCGTFSVAFRWALGDSVCRALDDYRKGCPEHGATVFCGHEPPTGVNCPWYRNGHALVRYPEDWRG